MNERHTGNDAKRQVTSSCHRFLKEAIDIAVSCFSSTELHKRTIHSWVMEPSGPGSHAGKELVHDELNMYAIWDRISSQVLSSESWVAAKDSLQQYIDVHKIEPSGIWPHDVESQYLMPLLRTYLEETGSFIYRRQHAAKTINSMLRHLDSPEVEVSGLIVLEGFEAERPFCLEPKLLVRLIEQSELLMLGRTDTLVGPGLGRGDHLPQTDWWICQARLLNLRGTAIGWNKVHDITDMLALALRAFKPGGVSIGLATTQLTSPFGRLGQLRGGRLQKIAVGESRYILSNREIPKFIAFWRRFRRLMEEPQHYLQIPVRRLRVAGTRAQKEDALVDYVIGLEALLGTEDERTELGYRFRVRGSVLLASRKNERKGHLVALRDLYDLRSRIVHGQVVPTEDLEKALPVAESALRRVWNWYFTHWYSESDNRTAIARVDEDLVG
jgi:hypothetical protein